MNVFIRVHDGAKDRQGTLYDSQFRRCDSENPQPSDLVITTSRSQWNQILSGAPTHLLIRVFEDKLDQSLANGTIFDDRLRQISLSSVHDGGRNPMLFTVTPDEFEAVRSAR